MGVRKAVRHDTGGRRPTRGHSSHRGPGTVSRFGGALRCGSALPRPRPRHPGEFRDARRMARPLRRMRATAAPCTMIAGMSSRPAPPLPWPSLPAVAERFAAAGSTLENVRRDFVEWHLGRPRYALWALDVDTAPLRRTLSVAAQPLAGLLLDDYRRQAHITVALRGFPARRPSRADEFGPTALAADVAALDRLAPPPFAIRTGGLASFTSAPFLCVADPDGGVVRLRDALHGTAPDAGGPYTPHITVGLYAGCWPTAEVGTRLRAVSLPAHTVPITRICLMAYAPPEIGGPLEILGHFDLAARRWEAAEAPLFV